MKNQQNNVTCNIAISGGNVQINTKTGPVTQRNEVYKPAVTTPAHAGMKEHAKPSSQVQTSVSDEAAMPESDDPLPAAAKSPTAAGHPQESAAQIPQTVVDTPQKPVDENVVTAVSPDAEAYQSACSRLLTYLPDAEVRNSYKLRLHHCTSAKEMGWIVVDMNFYDPYRITDKTIVKADFIRMVRALAPRVDCTVGNIRKYINDAWADRNQPRAADLSKQDLEALYNQP